MLNYKKNSFEDITKYEIDRLEHILKEFKFCTRLCDPHCEKVIAEFGFGGTLNDIKNSVKKLLNRYKKNGITEHDIVKLERQRENLMLYLNNLEKDGYRKKSKNLIKKGNFVESVRMMDKYRNRAEHLHNKKECVCYLNS